MGADIDPSPDVAPVAQGCNAHGLRVEDPDDILSALREAIAQVRGRRASVLDVKIQ
jgi:thiamine pyrophosphate-dependent acetolactate synthase large subunit-like protein